eukprot:m.62235 g.62235  ORF g.62235 m.62235 type:complete len:129 (+) comp8023_c2_seq1:95-481(+)
MSLFVVVILMVVLLVLAATPCDGNIGDHLAELAKLGKKTWDKKESIFKDVDMKTAFLMYDYNGDGKLDMREARVMYEDDPLSDAQLDQHLADTYQVLDIDHDGYLSYAEFATFFGNVFKNKPLMPELE